jgi:ABC-type uncharacterized transport system permease subunit
VVSIIFFITVALYAISGIAFFSRLLRRSPRFEQLAFYTLAFAVSAHIAFLISDRLTGDPVLKGHINQTLAAASALISIGYVLQMRRRHLTVLGVFIVPLALLFLLGAGLPSRGHEIPKGVSSAFIMIHVGFSTLGVVLFTLAFAVAVAYLIQDLLLRKKQISGVFQKLPPLDVLDTLGFRFVLLGFPLFTVGIILGSISSLRIGAGLINFYTPHGFALLAWLFFAFILLTRVVAGWRGRRAALGTVLGFLCAATTLLGYLLRNAGGM